MDKKMSDYFNLPMYNDIFMFSMKEAEAEKQVEAICHAINNHDKLTAENKRLKEIYKDVRKYIDNKTYDNAEKIAHIDILIDQAIGGE